MSDKAEETWEENRQFFNNNVIQGTAALVELAGHLPAPLLVEMHDQLSDFVDYWIKRALMNENPEVFKENP